MQDLGDLEGFDRASQLATEDFADLPYTDLTRKAIDIGVEVGIDAFVMAGDFAFEPGARSPGK